MSIIDKNQPNWFGNAGEPLKSAYIYIGQPNQTPVENPKTVTFTDSSGNAFTATQPLRTNSDGQIVWNGKAITATVEGDYSMLILDSTQTQINGGYIPLVEGEDSTVITLADYREYGLLLADIKKLDVSPGQTVGNIGKASVLDTLGADWLVVTATGSPADDVDLIDFDNALQGERIRNNLQPQDNLDNLADNAVARTNIGAQAVRADLANFVQAESVYVVEDISPLFLFSCDTTLTAQNVFESVGPSLSSRDQPWSTLDVLPTDAKFIDVAIVCEKNNGVAAAAEVSLYSRANGSASPIGPYTRIAHMLHTAADELEISTFARIAVDAENIFELAYDLNIGGAGDVRLYLRGFGV